jgi:hypothetical protein
LGSDGFLGPARPCRATTSATATPGGACLVRPAAWRTTPSMDSRLLGMPNDEPTGAGRSRSLTYTTPMSNRVESPPTTRQQPHQAGREPRSLPAVPPLDPWPPHEDELPPSQQTETKPHETNKHENDNSDTHAYRTRKLMEAAHSISTSCRILHAFHIGVRGRGSKPGA